MTTQQKSSYRFWFASLLIFALLATIQIVFLTLQNRELKKALGALPPAAGQPPNGLDAGEQVQSFAAVGADGKQVKISYDDANYLIFITSTKCPWCAKTLPAWKDIAAQAQGRGVRVVAVSVDGEGEIMAYKQTNGLNFDVVNFADAAALASYKAYSTPQTLFVKQGGKVERVWKGTLSDEAKQEVVKSIS